MVFLCASAMTHIHNICAVHMQLFNLAWYFLLGVSSALDTLASQAYGAADRAGVISWAITAAIVMSIFGVCS